MAFQPYIKPAFLDELKSSIKDSVKLERYLEEVFPIHEEMIQVLPQIKEPEGLADLMNPKNDFLSAIELYKAYNKLTPVQATDIHFWESLAHTTLFPYVKKRWPLTTKTLSSDYILHHWFVSSSSYVTRHSIASLWWHVYLSIDEDLENPFELTEVLFGNATFRTRTYGTSPIFAIKEANMGILRFLLDHPELVRNYEKAGNEIYKYFNRLGATKQLAFLDRNFFYKELEKVYARIMTAVHKDG